MDGFCSLLTWYVHLSASQSFTCSLFPWFPCFPGSLDRHTRFPNFQICCLPVYLLLAFVLSSPFMGVWGSGDGLFISSFRIILPNSGTLLVSDAGGLTRVLPDCFAESLYKSEFQSALPADQQAFGLLFSCSCLVTFIPAQVQN